MKITSRSKLWSRLVVTLGTGLLLSACVVADRNMAAKQDVSFPPSQPDEIRVFYNATILTMDEAFSTSQAIAIEGNKLIAVGSKAEVLEQVGDEAIMIDLQKKVVLPGFIDAHLHIVGAAQLSILEDVGLTRFRTVEEALEHMKQVGQNSRPGDWLLFTNLDFGTQVSQFNEMTADRLDKVSADNPVFVLHAGGHVASANSKMIELMGLTKSTPDPETGGKFGRSADGQPNGELYGFAVLPALESIEPFQNFDREKGIKEVSAQWSASGLTSIVDAGTAALKADELDLLKKLTINGSLQQRIRAYLSPGRDDLWFGKRGIKPNYGDAKLRIVGYKVSADGSNQARTGLQRDPYLGGESKGLPYMSEEQIFDNIVEKSKLGFQMAMHGNGDGAIDNIISAVGRAKQQGVTVIRPRIEHCSIIQDDQLQELKDLDISCSFLIGHVRLWGSAFRKDIFGQEKAEKLDRTGSFERVGIPYSLHSDASVTTFTPLEMVEIAVTRELFSEPGYILAPSERAAREMALRGVTSTAAWQMMSEHEIGSLEPGKLADFVVLEENPLTVKVDSIGEIKVLETWIDGEQVYRENSRETN